MRVEEIEWCWLNGQILPLSDAKVGVEDRGFIFADGVYEALRIYGGQPFAMDRHLVRLENSRLGLKLSNPLNAQELSEQIMRLIEHSGVRDGLLYLQLTRGQSRRNPIFPKNTPPTLMFFTRKLPPIVPVIDQPGAKLISVPDDRWRKCWIKAIGLTASILARNEAEDARMRMRPRLSMKDGIVAECTSSNLFVVIDNVLITHPVGPRVLPGVTRDVIIECAKSAGISVVERPIQIDEAKRTAEVFITSTTRHLMWIKAWDDKTIGTKCGRITLQLDHAFRQRVDDDTRG